MKRQYLAVLAVLLLGVSLARDGQAQVYPQGEIAIIVGVPQGEFEDNVDNAGVGLNLFAGIGLGRTPVVLGLDGSFLVYGFERRREPFSPSIPDVTVRVETSNAIAMGHMVLRLQPPRGAFQPYVDGLFGAKYFFTETTIRDDGRFDDEEIASTTNFDDAALSYGIGAGVDVQIFGKRGTAVMLNAGARYLFGREAEYLQEGSIERRSGRLFFATDRSETDILIMQLGIAVKF